MGHSGKDNEKWTEEEKQGEEKKNNLGIEHQQIDDAEGQCRLNVVQYVGDVSVL